MSESNASTNMCTVFKRKQKKRIILRNRVECDDVSDNDSDNEEIIKRKLNETKAAQKLRNKSIGLDVKVLNEISSPDDQTSIKDDPCNLEKGGLVDIPAIRNRKKNPVTEVDDTGIGAKFSTETNKRDEDDDMVKYIEEQMRNRRQDNSDGRVKRAFNQNNNNNNHRHNNSNVNEMGPNSSDKCSFEDAALHSVSNNLSDLTPDNSEEMLSNQMLNGIPEIDLGIETKIKNIEATEEAKLRLMWERQRKKEAPSQFVPTNMAVNFVQHNRFSMEESGMSINEEKNQLLKRRGIHVRSGKFDLNQKATDDYHYEKFKRQFRRY